MDNKIIGGVLLLGGVVIAITMIGKYLFVADDLPLKTAEEHRRQVADAAEEFGKEGAEEVLMENLPVVGVFALENFPWYRSKMLLSIANHDYSDCVNYYKHCHSKPAEGWDMAPYDFCSKAIVNYKDYATPIIVEIVDQGAEIIISPESARTRDEKIIHPDAYKWIVVNTECKSLDCEHYGDYAVGWQDARINGYSEDHTKFYDKVMEFAGMKKMWFGRGWKW